MPRNGVRRRMPSVGVAGLVSSRGATNTSMEVTIGRAAGVRCGWMIIAAALVCPRDARVAELVDAPDLGSGVFGCGGSSPPSRTSTVSRSGVQDAALAGSGRRSAFGHPGAGSVEATGDRPDRGGPGQALKRGADVDRLGLLDREGLVPDADRAGGSSGAAVERGPGRPVSGVPVGGVRVQLVDAAPVLHQPGP